MIDFVGVSKRFGRIEALQNIDLHIPKGHFFGLLGPNGAGKSTLMNVLSGIVRSDTGTVQVDGSDMHGGDGRVRYRLGLVPQSVAVYPTLDALTNLRICGRIYGLSRRTIRKRSQALLEQVGLWDRRKDPVREFSGGMKRRLNIAASLIHEPDYLLCDEPTVGVDPQSRNAIFEFLEAQRERGLTIIYTTHYMEEAERLCDRIAIIDHGSIIAEGTRDELLARTDATMRLRLKRSSANTAVIEATMDADYVWADDSASTYVATLPEGARLSQLYQLLEEHGLSYRALELRPPTLEDLFLHLTGKASPRMSLLFTLVAKDFRVFWADKIAVVVTFAVPMALMTIFGYVFGSSDNGPSGVRVMVIDEAQSAASQTLIEALEAEEGLRIVTQQRVAGSDGNTSLSPLTEAVARERLVGDASSWRFALIFPPDFEKQDFGFRVRYLYNPRSSAEHQIVTGLIQKTFFQTAFPLLTESLSDRLEAELGPAAIGRFQEDIAAAVADFTGTPAEEILKVFPDGSVVPDFNRIGAGEGATTAPDGASEPVDPLAFLLEIDDEQIAGKGKKPEAQSVGGWAVMFLLFTMTGAASALFEERDQAIFHRLLAGPVSRGAILGSKFTFLTLLGTIQLAVLFAFGQVMFGVIDSVDQLLPLAAMTLAGAAASTGFGMILCAISRSPAQANGLGTFLILSMSALGGAMFPIFMLPALIRDYVSKGTLVHWMMDGILQVLWEDARLPDIALNLGILVAIAAVTLAIALPLFRRGDLFR